jgi:hypothetical protein
VSLPVILASVQRNQALSVHLRQIFGAAACRHIFQLQCSLLTFFLEGVGREAPYLFFLYFPLNVRKNTIFTVTEISEPKSKKKYIKALFDVVGFTSIHVYWCGLGWNLVQVPLQSTSTHVD